MEEHVKARLDRRIVPISNSWNRRRQPFRLRRDAVVPLCSNAPKWSRRNLCFIETFSWRDGLSERSTMENSNMSQNNQNQNPGQQTQKPGQQQGGGQKPGQPSQNPGQQNPNR